MITGYSQETYPDLGAVGNWVGPAASSGANLFNKEPEGTHTGTYVYNSSNATPITWTAPLNGKLKGSGSVFLGWQSRYTGATEYDGTICRITTQAGTFDSAGSTPGGITEVVLGDNYEIEKLEFIGKSGNSYNGGLSWISPTADEASKWYSGKEVTTLTLTDDTDLENFRVGDSIDNRGVSPIRYGWFEPDAAYPSVDSNVIAFETATNLDLTSTAEQVLRDSTLVPPGADPTGWQEHLIVDMLNDTTDVLMTADGKNWQVNGSDSLQGPWENLGLINTPNRQSIRALVGSKRYALISYVPMPTSGWKLYNFKIEIQQSWIDAFVNGNNYLFAAGVVSQINTDNNQLILSPAYGTWNANQIAYGPDLGQPNGIVASSDFINNTITLASSENGRWAVNASKYGLGELDIPVENLTPITDEIIKREYIKYGAGASTPETSGLYIIDVEKMFNGILTYNESMVCGGSGTKRTVGMTFGTPIPFNELEIFCRNPNLASAQLIALYEDGSSDVILDGAEKDLRWVTATSQNKSLKGFDFVDSNNSASSAIAGIKVDGVLLTDGITLTLAGDKDLGAFVEGDDVYQDSGHTPTTSVITDVVSDGPYDYSSMVTQSSAGTIYGAIENVFDGNTSTNCYVLNAFDVIFTPVGGLIGSTEVFMQIYGAPTTPGAPTIFKVNGTPLNQEIVDERNNQGVTGTDGFWYPLQASAVTTIAWSGGGSDYVKVGAIRNNGTILVDGQAVITLTLTDDTDLENFRVGDVVQGTNISDTGAPAGLIPANSGAHQGGGWPEITDQDIGGTYDNTKQYWMYSAANQTVTFDFTGSLPIEMFVTTSKSSSPGNVLLTGDVVETEVIVDTTGVRGGVATATVFTPTKRDGTFTVTPKDPSTTLYWFAIQGNEKYRITGIDVADSKLNVDGGSWLGSDGSGDPDGDTIVTGPDTTPATGTVASTDSTANTMTLSVSDESGTKRWIANQDKTVIGPTRLVQKESRLYLVMDENLQVSDFTATEPDYIEFDGNNCEITFPTVLPSGETPDQRLPDGTTMRTRVIAANAAGTDVMTSNRITPIKSIGPNATMHGLRFDAK